MPIVDQSTSRLQGWALNRQHDRYPEDDEEEDEELVPPELMATTSSASSSSADEGKASSRIVPVRSFVPGEVLDYHRSSKETMFGEQMRMPGALPSDDAHHPLPDVPTSFRDNSKDLPIDPPSAVHSTVNTSTTAFPTPGPPPPLPNSSTAARSTTAVSPPLPALPGGSDGAAAETKLSSPPLPPLPTEASLALGVETNVSPPLPDVPSEEDGTDEGAATAESASTIVPPKPAFLAQTGPESITAVAPPAPIPSLVPPTAPVPIAPIAERNDSRLSWVSIPERGRAPAPNGYVPSRLVQSSTLPLSDSPSSSNLPSRYPSPAPYLPPTQNWWFTCNHPTAPTSTQGVPPALATVLRTRGVLKALLACLDWDAFGRLANASHAMRTMFERSFVLAAGEILGRPAVLARPGSRIEGMRRMSTARTLSISSTSSGGHGHRASLSLSGAGVMLGRNSQTEGKVMLKQLVLERFVPGYWSGPRVEELDEAALETETQREARQKEEWALVEAIGWDDVDMLVQSTQTSLTTYPKAALASLSKLEASALHHSPSAMSLAQTPTPNRTGSLADVAEVDESGHEEGTGHDNSDAASWLAHARYVDGEIHLADDHDTPAARRRLRAQTQGSAGPELEELAIAHSKFVALLRCSTTSRVRRSGRIVRGFDWHAIWSGITMMSRAAARRDPYDTRKFGPTELKFPAPLAYFAAAPPVPKAESAWSAPLGLPSSGMQVPTIKRGKSMKKDKGKGKERPSMMQRMSSLSTPNISTTANGLDSADGASASNVELATRPPLAEKPLPSPASAPSFPPRPKSPSGHSIASSTLSVPRSLLKKSRMSVSNFSTLPLGFGKTKPRAPLPPPKPTTSPSVAWHRSARGRVNSIYGSSGMAEFGAPSMRESASFGPARTSSFASGHVRAGSLPLPSRPSGLNNSMSASNSQESSPSSSSAASSTSFNSASTPKLQSVPSQDLTALPSSGSQQQVKERENGTAMQLSVMPNPHVLPACATHPFFAPVFRVYVPTSSRARVDGAPGEGAEVLQACEGQLRAAGVWPIQHRDGDAEKKSGKGATIRAGDIVVNLGYVPAPSPSPNGFTQDEEESSWMVFDGIRLTPFDAANPPIPFDLTLGGMPPRDAIVAGVPCPTYYAHVSGSGKGGANPIWPLGVPVHLLRQTPTSLPLTEAKASDWLAGVRFELTQVAKSLPSSMGPVRVLKYAWTASLDLRPASPVSTVPSSSAFSSASPSSPTSPTSSRQPQAPVDDVSRELGLWAGMWVLEAEGTPEGRALLERVLDESWRGGWGHSRSRVCRWEVVRERCEGDVLWLRYLSDC